MTELTLDKVHLHAGRAAAPKRRALRRLERASPTQPGAPSEVLILRRLADPAPGALGRALGENGLGDWDRALTGALERARARALRPTPGASLSNAEAVVFADEAEMYACLVECLAGTAEQAWWTQALLRRVPPGSGPEAVLRQQIHLLPAITEVLVWRNSASSVFSALPPAAAEALARDLGPFGAGRHSGPSANDQPVDTGDPADDCGDNPIAVDAPPALKNSLATLSPPQARLLAIGWVRRKRPNLAGALLTEAAETLMRTTRGHRVPDEPATTRKMDQSQSIQDRFHRGALPTPDGSDPQSRDLDAEIGTDGAEHTDQGGRSSKDPPSLEPAPPLAGAPLAQSPDPAVSPGPETTQNSTPATEAETAPVTDLGGIFFLINVFSTDFALRARSFAKALKMSKQPEYGPWSRLERLARATLEETAPHVDPIWGLLATLDGRPVDTPAHPAELDRIAAQELCAWLGRVAWGPDGPSEGQSPAGLLRRRARIFVAPMHIDVVFPASAQSLPVRRAGLDLDPGWHPAFGRIVAFHYREHEVI
ncbi:hypothetical protein [Mameliella sp.]|uniref:hypothetical protein n=1 Tax=Mameliella sp. TaxID=1924940 RepID=UPI003B4FFC8D